jgi:hypothetical protein
MASPGYGVGVDWTRIALAVVVSLALLALVLWVASFAAL